MQRPTVDVHTPFHTKETSFEDVDAGDGTPITSENQLVVVDITLISGETGKTIATTEYNGDLTAVRPVSALTELFPSIDDALHCATEGSRVVVALPPGGVAAQTASSLGLDADESSIAVIDLRKVYLPKADGSNVYNTRQGLPTVVRAPDGRPGIIVPDDAPPEDLVVQTIKKGDGAGRDRRRAGARALHRRRSGTTKTVFDTTWDGEPEVGHARRRRSRVSPPRSRVQTVGSQIMVVVPPAEGYEDQAQGAIPANSTLVFVIDILGLDAAPAATPIATRSYEISTRGVASARSRVASHRTVCARIDPTRL